MFFATTKKLSSDVENMHFPHNAAKAKWRREMVMENKEMVMEKYFVESVGTLHIYTLIP